MEAGIGPEQRDTHTKHLPQSKNFASACVSCLIYGGSTVYAIIRETSITALLRVKCQGPLAHVKLTSVVTRQEPFYSIGVPTE